jgi:lantibiotic modifying enzyme
MVTYKNPRNSPQTGMTFGISGILFSLLQHHDLLTSDEKTQIKNSINFLLKLKLPNGNFPINCDGTDERDYVQFEKGVSGIILLLLQAQKVFGGKYLEEAISCAKTVWQRGLVTSGNGLGSGISGNFR